MKKILGLVISQRRLGNSELLVKEIMSNVPGDNQLDLIRLTDFNIRPCIACYRCLEPDTQCPQDDDFNFIMDKIKDADALVIGVPVYILGPHGYYKMLNDRLVGSFNYTARTAGKPCIIVIPYGTIGWQGYSRAAATILPRLLQMKVLDCWEVHATLPAESFLNPENITYAQKLGQTLFTAADYIPAARECIQCGSDLFRLLPDNRIECPICGAIGILGPDNIPDFNLSAYNRFGAHEIEEHFQGWVVGMKRKYWQDKDKLREVQKTFKNKQWWVKPEKIF
jgi:multimeric flavodoxin WrbA